VPVVALLGPRQVGKTTLALRVAKDVSSDWLHLDMERDSDLARLSDAEGYLHRQAGRLVIIDEIQRKPELFPVMRSLVDERIRAGEKTGQFLVLGSASRDLLRQSSETLAGRISYLELRPFVLSEVARGSALTQDQLWVRGGFPLSALAGDDDQSRRWREDFISTYLERDLPQLGLRLPAEQLRRLWTMLAHLQGEPLNAARLAASLGVAGSTLRRYLDTLTDLYMLRQLRPWAGNVGKRLVKSPKIYLRDSGLLHRLLKIPDLDALEGHPVVGRSWEGFAIENVLAQLSPDWQASYFRTAAQAEIDLVLEGPRSQVVAIEVKRTLSPRVGRGFLNACEDVKATHRFYVIPAGEDRPMGHDTEGLALTRLLSVLDGLV
jgi:hypothetical protein